MSRWVTVNAQATAPVVAPKKQLPPDPFRDEESGFLIDQDPDAYESLQKIVDVLANVPGSGAALDLAKKFAREPGKYKAEFLAAVDDALGDPVLRGLVLRATALEVFKDMRAKSAIESAFEED